MSDEPKIEKSDVRAFLEDFQKAKGTQGGKPEKLPDDEDLKKALDISEYPENEIVRVPIPKEIAEKLRRGRQADEDTDDESEEEENPRIVTEPDGPFSVAAKMEGEKAGIDERMIHGIGLVTATEADKEEFIRAFWADDRFVLSVSILLKGSRFEARIRSLTTYEREVIYEATEKVRKSRPTDTGAFSLEYFQRMSALIQLLQVNGKDFPFVDIPFDDKKEAAADMLISAAEKFGAIVPQQARWQALITLLRIFEAKQAILEDALANEDFFASASIV